MQLYKNFITLTLTLLVTLLFTACDGKTKTEAAQTQNPTTQPTSEGENSAEGTDSGGGVTTGGGTNDNATTGSTNDDNITAGTGDDTNTTGSGGGSENANTGTTPTPTPTTPSIILRSLTLTLDKTSLTRNENTIVKVVATYSDNTSKEVTEQVEWIVTPNDAVKVTDATLTALYDKETSIKAKVGTTLSNVINLNIVWIVSGHTLPPEPDKEENDKTLLGIDSNNDGVRDDIERKVYATYPKAIQRAVMMQAFRAKQKMLADLDMVSNARIWEKEVTKYIDCGEYLYFYKKQIRMKRKDAELTSEWQFNNEERVKKYMDYNKALSGGVISMNDPYLQACEFDIEKVLKLDK